MQSWWKNNFFSWKNTDAVVLKEEFWENHKNNNNNTLTFLFPIGTQSGFGQAHSPITSWVHFVAQLISGIGGRGPKSAPIDDGIAIRGLVSVVLPVVSACILPISVANISVVVSSVSVVLPVLSVIKPIISLSWNQGC